MKNYILVLIGTISSALFWLKANPWLEDPLNWTRVSLWLWPLLLLIISISVLSLSLFLLSRHYLRLLVLTIHLVLYIFFFGAQPLLLGGALVALGLGLWAAANIQKEKANRFKFDLHGMLKGGIHRLLTATFILISFAYFVTPAVQAASEKKELPPGLARTVQVIVNNFVGQELGAGNQQFVNQASQEVIKQVNTFLEPYFQYVPPILAFSLFLVLQGLSVVFLWLTMLFSSIIFLMLKLFKVVTLGKMMKEADVVVF